MICLFNRVGIVMRLTSGEDSNELDGDIWNDLQILTQLDRRRLRRLLFLEILLIFDACLRPGVR